MQEIAKNIYIEDRYPGVTLGAIVLPQTLIQVDAPPSPEDGRAWRAALLNLCGGAERMLVNLDAHPDRTIGARAMDCPIIAHEKTANVFRARPSTFKAQVEETGADWESLIGLGSIRWASPEITFSNDLTLRWGDSQIVLEHRPGPSAGAIWVHLPEQKVVFVGDAIIKNQPPFLAAANLPAWIESLELLFEPDYRSHIVVSGRGGSVSSVTIHNQIDYLKRAHVGLEKLAARHARVETTEKLIDPLLAALKLPASKQKLYAQRLRYGIQHYYARHYHPTSRNQEEE
jgi:cyclase